MALNKFTWQNGTQVEPAKVEIDGVSYDVTDAQYEGETPLSASNLNLMQDTLLGNVTDDLDDDTKIPSVKAVKDIYSTTEEIKTKKVYIENGVEKPIYRNYIKVLNPSLSSSNITASKAHGIANIDKIIRHYEWKITDTTYGSLVGYFPFMHSTGRNATVHTIDSTNVTFRSYDTFTANSYYFEGYVEYTKTTD